MSLLSSSLFNARELIPPLPAHAPNLGLEVSVPSGGFSGPRLPKADFLTTITILE